MYNMKLEYVENPLLVIRIVPTPFKYTYSVILPR